MSSEWKTVPIESLCLGIYDGPHATPKKTQSGPIFLGISSLNSGQLDLSNTEHLSEDDFSKWTRRVTPAAGDIVFSYETRLGQVAAIPPGLRCCLGRRMALMRVDPEKVTSDYLLYAYLSPDFQEVIRQRTIHGSTVDRIPLVEFGSFPITVPSLETQNEVVGVLRSLDNRITLLRETNATLEAIAQALFKSWFVDFDPVRAKMDGRAPEGMDEATAALFPDGLDESELGLVPRGWSCRPVYDLATYINGAAYKAFEPNAERRGRPIIKIAELKCGVTQQTAYSDVAMPEKYLIRTGDILFSWSGNPDTSIDTFVWTHDPAWLNQHIFRVLPHKAIERTFILQLLRSLRPVFAELARNKQTTGLGHVTVADLKRLRVVRPIDKLVELYDLVAGPVQARIFANEQQAQTLATLRDTLLPRLISGQLRLPAVA